MTGSSSNHLSYSSLLMGVALILKYLFGLELFFALCPSLIPLKLHQNSSYLRLKGDRKQNSPVFITIRLVPTRCNHRKRVVLYRKNLSSHLSNIQ